MIDLSGSWSIYLETDKGIQTGKISIPGILQNQGYGNAIDKNTPWVSGLHDPIFYEREEYDCIDLQQEGHLQVSFLSQPKKHFLGEAAYFRKVTVFEAANYYLYIELVKQRSSLFIDGEFRATDFSLCTPHILDCGYLSEGEHEIKIIVDNSMQYPYRPDGHGVSDAIGATWNGMAGKVTLMSEIELKQLYKEKKEYAKEHPVKIEVIENKFYLNDTVTYFRGTHFGGDFPVTGYPSTDTDWWRRIFNKIREYGMNFVRCHSFCPPEAAFIAADELGIAIQVECGMWNHFEKDISMLEILDNETKRILQNFGHHPSFVLFSPTNEPSGDWYKVLREWVSKTREYDLNLGYEKRRVYTAQSGWYYDVETSKIEGTDYIYFHRSAHGPIHGGMIRNHWGWKGKNYSPSVYGAKKPVISHELGQWCSYPDYDVISKYENQDTYLRPENFKIFKKSCEKNNLLSVSKAMAWASGKNQLRLYKEDLEATFRTPEIQGFELLDLHDYTGQGTALVGVLDPFFEEKSYTTSDSFREFCSETVILATFDSYVISQASDKEVPLEICHYGGRDITGAKLKYKLREDNCVYFEKELCIDKIVNGKNTKLSNIHLDFGKVNHTSKLIFEITLTQGEKVISRNSYTLHYFKKEEIINNNASYIETRDFEVAIAALKKGQKVIYNPYLSDLNFDCPSISMKNIFWNAQMGPTWDRSLGLLIEETHPIFKYFPSEKSGGWQWEDIINHARAFNMSGLSGISPIVRVIDDWNRNLPLSLMWEACYKTGKLFVVTADLSGEFTTRPEAYTLMQAIRKYVSSDEFKPQEELLSVEEIKNKLFNPFATLENLESVNFDKPDASPNVNHVIKKQDFPIALIYEFKEKFDITRMIYMPAQKERNRLQFIKDYRVYAFCEDKWVLAKEGSFKNTSLTQTVSFDLMLNTDKLKIDILSTFGTKLLEIDEYVEDNEGYKKQKTAVSPEVVFSGFYFDINKNCYHGNSRFWLGESVSTQKEIDI